MAVPLSPVLKTAVWAVVAPFALYLTFLAIAVTPLFQPHLLYLHRINGLWLRGINEPELFGFAKGQVTPFFLQTPDNESIYTWHITPLPCYLQNEEILSSQPSGIASEFSETESFRVLKEDPEARVIIYLHGNAGDVAQAHRPDSYHVLTDTSPYNVFSIDYRGFGHSTGNPSEPGLILDASTLVDWVMNVAGIPSDRIVLLGQSLGTAVATGVAERFAEKGVEFGGVILVAGFSSLSNALTGYRFGGVVPVLGPLKSFPSVISMIDRFVYERWPTTERLERLVRLTKNRLRLSIIAALDDPDMPYVESNKMFQTVANATLDGKLDEESFDAWKDERTVRKRDDAFVTTIHAERNIIVRQEIFPYGGEFFSGRQGALCSILRTSKAHYSIGHNAIMSYAPVVLAVMRSFDLGGTVYG